MRKTLMVALALSTSFACVHPLPPPQTPLVATPDEQWRSHPPKLSVSDEPSACLAPYVHKLQDETVVYSAQVPNASFVDAWLVARHFGDKAAALMVTEALRATLTVDDPTSAPLEASADAFAGYLHFRGELSELDRILDGLAKSLRTAPLDAAFSAVGHEVFHEMRVERVSSIDAFMLGLEDSVRGRIPSEIRYDQENLPPATPAQLKGLHRAMFAPERRAVIVVGPEAPELTAERFAKRVELKPWKRAKVAQQQRLAPTGDRRVRLVPAYVHLPIVGFGVSVDEADEPAAKVLAAVLGGDPSSGLNETLREDAALTYGVSTTYIPDPEGGMLSGWLQVDDRRVGQALTTLHKKLRELSEDVPDQEIDAAQAMLRTAAMLSSRRTDKWASALAYNFAAARDLSEVCRMVKAPSEVSPQAVKQLAKKLFPRARFAAAGTIWSLAASLQWTPYAHEVADLTKY